MSPDSKTGPISLLHKGLDYQFVRFVLVGILNTGFAYLVYAVLLFVGLHYSFASLGTILLGILFSFRTQGRFVFNNTDLRRIGRFVLAWALIYFMAIGVIHQLVTLGINAYLAGALSLPLTTLASYLVQRFFVFRTASGGTEQPQTYKSE